MVSQSWRDVANNPNDPVALARRQETLTSAAAGHPKGKERFLLDRCHGLHVLDLGCAGQSATLADPKWLHRKITRAARSSVGADYERSAVEEIRLAGFDVVHADVNSEPSAELAAKGPFDVVVAAELIEHLECPQALFRFAARLLKPGGSLLVTSPNPFALHRVAAGRRGRSKDNCDHVILAFPSGIAELADRTGFEMVMYATTPLQRRRSIFAQAIRSELGRLRNRTWDRPYSVPPVLDVLGAWGQWDNGLIGETCLYECRLGR